MSTQSYQVPSSGRLGVVHTVTVYPDGLTDCTCEDSTYRRRQCRHQRQVLAGAVPPQPVAESAPTAAELAWRNEGAYLASRARDLTAGW
jgi:hypothetical protein